MSQECPPHSRYQDLLAALLGLFCALMLLVSPWQIDLDVPYAFYKGPILVPMLVLLMGSLASVPAWIRLIRPIAGSIWYLDGKGVPARPLVMLALGALYPFGIMYIGLEVSTLIILALELYYLGIRKPMLLMGIPAIVTFIFWLVFKFLLDVYFPTPELIYMLQGA